MPNYNQKLNQNTLLKLIEVEPTQPKQAIKPQPQIKLQLQLQLSYIGINKITHGNRLTL
jgi:hypothetical protein